ncbi:hypothetical protein [Streptomyces sp. NPDC088812]|uniref:hypothetical protein n=1 Tax=Streptomyces sp. NPDC088812 TaxID=3365905 RepID=UPI00381EED0C
MADNRPAAGGTPPRHPADADHAKDHPHDPRLTDSRPGLPDAFSGLPDSSPGLPDSSPGLADSRPGFPAPRSRHPERHPADARPHPDPRPADARGTRPSPVDARGTRPSPAEARAAHPRPADPHPAATTQTALWITQLLQQLPELAAELVPGRTAPAHRPATAPAPADLADRLRAEREEALLLQQQHGLVAPGHSAAPLRLHISDALRDISDGVVELEEAVRDRLGLPRARRAPVPERLRRIAALLDGIGADPVLAAHVRDETRRMARRCARALGDTETVVRVSGRCPWCDSVSLRAFPDRGAVLCINPACRCPEPDCGCHDDPAYRHTWDENEWEAAAR